MGTQGAARRPFHAPVFLRGAAAASARAADPSTIRSELQAEAAGLVGRRGMAVVLRRDRGAQADDIAAHLLRRWLPTRRGSAHACSASAPCGQEAISAMMPGTRLCSLAAGVSIARRDSSSAQPHGGIRAGDPANRAGNRVAPLPRGGHCLPPPPTPDRCAERPRPPARAPAVRPAQAPASARLSAPHRPPRSRRLLCCTRLALALARALAVGANCGVLLHGSATVSYKSL